MLVGAAMMYPLAGAGRKGTPGEAVGSAVGAGGGGNGCVRREHDGRCLLIVDPTPLWWLGPVVVVRWSGRRQGESVLTSGIVARTTKPKTQDPTAAAS